MPFCFYVSHIRVTTTHSRTRGTGETVRVRGPRFTNHGHWCLMNFCLCGQEKLCVFKRIFVLLREPLFVAKRTFDYVALRSLCYWWTFVLRSEPTCIFVPVMRIKPSLSMVLCLCFNNLSVVLSGPLSLDVYTWCFKSH